MSGAEEYLADVGRAADELGLGVVRVDTDEIEFIVVRGKADYRVTVRQATYRRVDGNALRAIFAPPKVEPKKCGCGHPPHPGLVCGHPFLKHDDLRSTCECEG